MSSVTPSSPTLHTGPCANGTKLPLPVSSWPVASNTSSPSHQPINVGAIHNNVTAAAAAAADINNVQAEHSHNESRDIFAAALTNETSSPIQTVDNGNVQAPIDTNALGRDNAVTPSLGSAPSENESNDSPSISNKENASPKTRGPRRKLMMKRPDERAAPLTPLYNKAIVVASDSGDNTGSSGTISSGLTLKLRCIQSALREPLPKVNSFPPHAVGTKRPTLLAFPDDVDDTDSEIEIMPKRLFVKHTAESVTTQHNSSASSLRGKRTKVAHSVVSKDEDDAMFDAGDEGDSISEDAGPSFSLLTPALKRRNRILNASYAPHAQLVANSTKAGPEYYDSDAEDAPGEAKDTGKPHLFRNVTWGVYATDYTNDADFVKEPEFTQFVPGRFELLPDGTVSDQKAKLVIKILDKSGRKRIFANPPPRDWNNQEAVTALNKRTVQQIRRNTNVRFREVVRAYVPEERRWILANLTAGKPSQGWKVFVEEFNKRFEGKVVTGANGTRPYRSHSSLTKEVERFGPDFYAKGLVPAPAARNAKKG
ncbi:hypothetical protein T440DRAFT_523234 [Plenodomus tracheiphilus IPT5]|uniref:Uncharacterized protein n=1 Tax=Plenodomus tracheiphilus IPT5 TaxID=1408161 RepID=A0A6A7AR00_9PLEO|nr:hypothetical protein T440DRAFT_523234 [Plenodomus tracheiphilus IPT5]